MPCCTTAQSPSAVTHEAVQVDLEAVGDGVVVDARREPAGAHQRVAVEADAIGDRAQLVRRVARLLAAPAADVDAELVRPRVQAALQRAHHRRRDARRVPVHAHHAAERLEPERIAQPRQQRRPAVVDAATLSAIAVPSASIRAGQPRRHAAAVQRQIGDAGALHPIILPDCSRCRLDATRSAESLSRAPAR